MSTTKLEARADSTTPVAEPKAAGSSDKLADALRNLVNYLPFDWAFDEVREYAERPDKDGFRDAVREARAALASYEAEAEAKPAPEVYDEPLELRIGKAYRDAELREGTMILRADFERGYRAALEAKPAPAVEPAPRTAQEIVDKTEELAGALMLWAHRREAKDGHGSYRDAEDPRGKSCWQMACKAQEILTATDPENAVSELDDEPAAPAAPAPSREALLETLLARAQAAKWPGDTPAAPAPEIQWPKARDVGRLHDMSPAGHLRVGLDNDNDVYVSVFNDEQEALAGVEFCNGGGGGGRSMRTRLALIALMVAMEADNAERPDLDFWARRNGAASKGEKA